MPRPKKKELSDLVSTGNKFAPRGEILNDWKLPEVLENIEEVIRESLIEKGFTSSIAEKVASDAICNFSKTFGGQNMAFPKTIPQPDSATPLPEVLQSTKEILHCLLTIHAALSDDAEKLAFELMCNITHRFGGEIFYFPKNAHFSTARRNKELVKALDNGTSTKELARKYNLTERRIYQISNSRYSKS